MVRVRNGYGDARPTPSIASGEARTPDWLPVVQPMRFDFVVNVSTVEILGLTIPETIRVFATEFID